MSDFSSDTAGTIESGTFEVPLWRSAVIALAVAATLAICLVGQNPNSPTQAGVRLDLPLSVGDFWGYEQEITESEKTILPGDTQFARRLYVSTNRRNAIDCRIVLSGGQRRSIHRPEICLPGQGWTLRSGEAIPIKLESGHTLDVMKLDLSREDQVGPNEKRRLRAVFLYWFVGKGVTTPYHWNRILRTSYDRVVRNVNHRWAYVIVSSNITADFDPNGKNEEQTVEMLKDFIRKAVPSFQVSEMP